jgi:hypothetical protein
MINFRKNGSIENIRNKRLARQLNSRYVNSLLYPLNRYFFNLLNIVSLKTLFIDFEKNQKSLSRGESRIHDLLIEGLPH